MTKIMQCDCVHEDQDKMYGKKNRVHNSCGKDAGKWRCTVCKKEKS